jgi:hypothetical protein
MRFAALLCTTHEQNNEGRSTHLLLVRQQLDVKAGRRRVPGQDLTVQMLVRRCPTDCDQHYIVRHTLVKRVKEGSSGSIEVEVGSPGASNPASAPPGAYTQAYPNYVPLGRGESLGWRERGM